MTKLRLSLPAQSLDDARAFEMDLSSAAEACIEKAVKHAKEETWLAENADAIRAHNERIDRHGTLTKPM